MDPTESIAVIRYFLPFLFMVLSCQGDLSSAGQEKDTPKEKRHDLTQQDGSKNPDSGRPDQRAAKDSGDPKDANMVNTDTNTNDMMEKDLGGPPCQNTCTDTQTCDLNTDQCICREGLVDTGNECVLAAPGEPATREKAQVCTRWREAIVENANPKWIPDGLPCGTGSLPPEAIDDTLRRTNVYRWLAGLPNVVDDTAVHQAQMECAAMLSYNSQLSHNPPTSWTCYTQAGAAAASRSNETFSTSAARAVDAYMFDAGVASLGHRRWILNSALKKIGIGFSKANGQGGHCLAVTGRGGSTDRTWVAYPNPGPVPMALTRGVWSFHSFTQGVDATTRATIVRLSDGMTMPVTIGMAVGSGSPFTLKMTLDGWAPAPNEVYRVRVSNLKNGIEVQYDVKPVDC